MSGLFVRFEKHQNVGVLPCTQEVYRCYKASVQCREGLCFKDPVGYTTWTWSSGILVLLHFISSAVIGPLQRAYAGHSVILTTGLVHTILQNTLHPCAFDVSSQPMYCGTENLKDH